MWQRFAQAEVAFEASMPTPSQLLQPTARKGPMWPVSHLASFDAIQIPIYSGTDWRKPSVQVRKPGLMPLDLLLSCKVPGYKTEMTCTYLIIMAGQGGMDTSNFSFQAELDSWVYVKIWKKYLGSLPFNW